MSTALRKLQEDFQNYILNANDTILQDVSGKFNQDRIDIYKNAYVLRLLEILSKDFPILRKHLGNDSFDQLGKQYIKCYPSNHFNICTFSRHFSDFLFETNQDPYLVEMTAFEWVLACALDAANADQISINELTSIAPESLPLVQFDFHPSVNCYQYRYNAPLLVYAYMLEKPTPELVEYEQPRSWLIWRNNMQSYFESLTTEQLWIFNAVQEGNTFADICEGLCQFLPEEEVAVYTASTLRNWLEKGLFSAIKITETVIA